MQIRKHGTGVVSEMAFRCSQAETASQCTSTSPEIQKAIKYAHRRREQAERALYKACSPKSKRDIKGV